MPKKSGNITKQYLSPQINQRNHKTFPNLRLAFKILFSWGNYDPAKYGFDDVVEQKFRAQRNIAILTAKYFVYTLLLTGLSAVLSLFQNNTIAIILNDVLSIPFLIFYGLFLLLLVVLSKIKTTEADNLLVSIRSLRFNIQNNNWKNVKHILKNKFSFNENNSKRESGTINTYYAKMLPWFLSYSFSPLVETKQTGLLLKLINNYFPKIEECIILKRFNLLEAIITEMEVDIKSNNEAKSIIQTVYTQIFKLKEFNIDDPFSKKLVYLQKNWLFKTLDKFGIASLVSKTFSENAKYLFIAFAVILILGFLIVTGNYSVTLFDLITKHAFP